MANHGIHFIWQTKMRHFLSVRFFHPKYRRRICFRPPATPLTKQAEAVRRFFFSVLTGFNEVVRILQKKEDIKKTKQRPTQKGDPSTVFLG